MLLCLRLNIIIPVVLIFSVFLNQDLKAQCFASAGNPMGGSANMGVMNKNSLRVMAFYRYQFARDYYEGDAKYSGQARIYRSANYNYAGTLLGYGISDRLSTELETGYFLNKSVNYRSEVFPQQTGFGLSNALVSMKYALYQNPEKRFEITGAAGVNIPYRKELQRVDGSVLPYDVQPSTAAYGIVLQSYLIKENSFKSIRYFWINRFDKNFTNPDGYVFGSVFNSSAFFSRHFIFGQGIAKDWTLILQLRYQHTEPNVGYKENASGGRSLIFSPQVNCSLHEIWNISVLFEKPLYQYYHGIQLGINYAFLINIARDFHFNK